MNTSSMEGNGGHQVHKPNFDFRISCHQKGFLYFLMEVIQGKCNDKLFLLGAMDPRCKLCIFMGKTDPSLPKHKQQVRTFLNMYIVIRKRDSLEANNSAIV